jgi:hypothetical protein
MVSGLSLAFPAAFAHPGVLRIDLAEPPAALRTMASPLALGPVVKGASVRTRLDTPAR